MAKLEDVLDECLSRLRSGEATLEACIASYPEHADELRRLVTVANQVERGQNIHLSAAFKARLRAQVITYANAHPHKRAFFGWWDNILSIRLAFSRALNFALGAVVIVLFFPATPFTRGNWPVNRCCGYLIPIPSTLSCGWQNAEYKT